MGAELIAAYREQLYSLAEDGDANWTKIRSLLRELRAIGSEEAIGLALEVMSDPSMQFAHKAESFAEILQDCGDPRVLGYARDALEQALRIGGDSWYEVGGYLELVARHGGEDGGRLLLEVVQDHPGQLADIAARNLADVDAPGLAPEVLALALDVEGNDLNLSVRRSLLESLAAWQDPESTTSLWATIHGDSVPYSLREASSQAIGRCLDPDQFARMEASFWESGSAETRDVLLAGLAAHAEALESLTPGLVERLSSVARDSLGSSHGDLFGRALNLLESVPAAFGPGERALLLQIQDSPVASNHREQIDRLLGLD